MVVNNFNVGRARCAFCPFEAYTPLVVNTDTELAFAVSCQCLKAVARQGGEIAKRDRRLYPIQFKASRPFDTGKRLHPLPIREIPGPLVAITEDHTLSVPILYALRKA